MSELITQGVNIAGPVTAAQRLWLTADGKDVVPEGHPRAASLLAAKGHVIPHAEAERLGLLGGGLAEPETMTNDEAQVEVAEEAGIPNDAAIMSHEDAQIRGVEAQEQGSLESHSINDLRKLAKEAGLDPLGTKVDLIERLNG